jgi:hypothetical protein
MYLRPRQAMVCVGVTRNTLEEALDAIGACGHSLLINLLAGSPMWDRHKMLCDIEQNGTHTHRTPGPGEPRADFTNDIATIVITTALVPLALVNVKLYAQDVDHG